MDEGYRLAVRVPTIAEYRRLRVVAGLTPRSREAAAAGLPGTIIGVVIERDGVAIGMGRVIGDGGLAFELVDIAVDPAHQGQGVGKAIVGRLMQELKVRVSAEAHVSLTADGEAHRLYAQYGFEPTAPASIGMALWLR